MTHSLRLAGRAAVAATVASIAACGGGPKLHPVTGKVFYLDQPAEGATVVFQPVNSTGESLMPSGTVGPDGTFTLRTGSHGEGAPAGEYVVVITWYPGGARGQEDEDKDDLGEPTNRLPARYGSPTESRLRATVISGPNELEPFRLTK